MHLIYKFFKLNENKTTIKQEFLASIITFLAMLYIIPVGSDILHQAGMPKDALITSIALMTAIATLLTGLWANAPVAMSVGMGLNAFFTFSLVQGSGLAWQQALGAVFLSGIFFLIISFTKLRIWILKSIPKEIRIALCAGLGAFIATIGLKGLGFIQIDSNLLKLGDLHNPSILIGIFGVIFLLFLQALRIQGNLILGILTCAILAWVLHITPMPKEIISMPANPKAILMQIDILSILKISLIPAILALLITDLFDSLGTLSGIGIKAGMFQDTSGKDKQLERTLQVDALATTIGPLFGLSTTTAFLESAAGVNAGGRTGLTAIFIAFFFLLSLFFMPIFEAIPSFAIYPALIVVGAMMFSEIRHIDFSDFSIAIPVFFIIILMPLTTSITNGLAAGFSLYVILSIFEKKFERLNLGVFVLFIISLIPFILPA